ncbi:MAG: hypothetical protein ACQEUT_14325 [Bacillota bacterium]
MSVKNKSISALISTDRQMFEEKKGGLSFYFSQTFDPEGLKLDLDNLIKIIHPDSFYKSLQK